MVGKTDDELRGLAAAESMRQPPPHEEKFNEAELEELRHSVVLSPEDAEMVRKALDAAYMKLECEGPCQFRNPDALVVCPWHIIKAARELLEEKR